MSNQPLSPAMSALWQKADQKKVGLLYATATRNPDPAIRSKFNSELKIEGTKSWAIYACDDDPGCCSDRQVNGETIATRRWIEPRITWFKR